MKKICPRCKLEIKGYPALSRKDNKTEICDRCGAMEAIDEWMRNRGLETLKEWEQRMKGETA